MKDFRKQNDMDGSQGDLRAQDMFHERSFETTTFRIINELISLI